MPPETLNPPVEVAFENEELRATRDPKLEPPETVSPVVVAFPKLELLVTLMAPKDAPPVTDNDVEVPAPKTNEPNKVPPFTESPVVVAFPKNVAPETVRLVVEALPKRLVKPETVKPEPIYAGPTDELIAKPLLIGEVVPIPILPSAPTKKSEDVGVLMLKA